MLAGAWKAGCFCLFNSEVHFAMSFRAGLAPGNACSLNRRTTHTRPHRRFYSIGANYKQGWWIVKVCTIFRYDCSRKCAFPNQQRRDRTPVPAQVLGKGRSFMIKRNTQMWVLPRMRRKFSGKVLAGDVVNLPCAIKRLQPHPRQEHAG